MSALDIRAILEHLPHRYPMLLVDRVVELEKGKRIVAYKNVTINEPFFQGHFPGHPIMPGVLIIEAMAQVGGMLLMGAVADPEKKVVYFTSLNNVKWPVSQGGEAVGQVTSAIYSPRLEQNIGFAWLPTALANLDSELDVDSEWGRRRATVVEMPFVDPKKQIPLG